MDRYETKLATDFKDRVARKVEEESRRLVTTPAADHASYMNRVGLIKGLDEAVKILKSVQDDLGREARNDKGEEKKNATASYES